MTANQETQVQIAADGSQATLIAPPGLATAMVTPSSLASVVKAAGVLIDKEVAREIAAFAAAYGSGVTERRTIIARSVPPVAGEDGRMEGHQGFELIISSGHAPGSVAERTDHYAGLNYVQVKTADIVGAAHKPTEGTDGRDVRGGVIKAQPGKPIPIKLHPTLTLDSLGRIIAEKDGVLVLRENELSVIQSLEVPGYVDFSTGHITFAGSVKIAGGVRPGFKVTADGDIHVGGLIESAEIRCGADFVARGGMAGSGRGTISVGRNAQIVYLDKVTGTCSGNLDVEREIVDCKLVVGQDLNCPNGAILGGEIAVTGSLVVKVIGSAACIPTTISLGDVPLLQASRRAAVKVVDQIKQTLTQLTAQERLVKMKPRPSAADREMLTETAYELSQQNNELVKWTAKLDAIEIAARERRKLDLHIAKAIHPNVKFHIGEFAIHFKDTVKGPVWIYWDEQRQLVYKTGSVAPRALSEIAQIVRMPAARPAEGTKSAVAA